MTGASGLVGTALGETLIAGGHEVVRLVRRRPMAGSDEVYWNPARAELDSDALEGTGALIHLSGRSIARGRWSKRVKREIWESRVASTELLARKLPSMKRPPEVFLSASAIGYYGDRGDEVLDESSPPGHDFLARLGVAWEAASAPLEEAGLRTAQLRFGIVLARGGGGVLDRMLPAFRLGLGAVLGSGRQYLSWISIDDLQRIVVRLLERENVRGPVNLVSPHPVTNRDFTRFLARAVSRPAFLKVPSWAIGILFGEMGRTALLGSARVVPARLEELGYEFLHPNIDGALQAIVSS